MFDISAKIDPKLVKDVSTFFDRSNEAATIAARAAMKSVTDDILKLGRVNIAASGKFGARWQRGLQAKTYPKRVKPHPNVKTYINHRYGGLASVFEFGATIRPKKGRYLWVALPGAPKRVKIGTNFETGRISSFRTRNTPTNLSEAKGGLEFIKSKKSGLPMLGYKVGKGNRVRFKPAFIGIRKATIRKRWEIIRISTEQADRNLIPRFLAEFDKAYKNG
jgi:hypothetical protein